MLFQQFAVEIPGCRLSVAGDYCMVPLAGGIFLVEVFHRDSMKITASRKTVRLYKYARLTDISAPFPDSQESQPFCPAPEGGAILLSSNVSHNVPSGSGLSCLNQTESVLPPAKESLFLRSAQPMERGAKAMPLPVIPPARISELLVLGFHLQEGSRRLAALVKSVAVEAHEVSLFRYGNFFGADCTGTDEDCRRHIDSGISCFVPFVIFEIPLRELHKVSG